MKLFKIGRSGERKQKEEKREDELLIPPLAKDQIGISREASEHIARLLAQKGEPNLFLRVLIRGGGCSGLSLHYEFCPESTPRDHIFTKDQTRVVIDQKSLFILGGATLHAREYLGSYEFVLINNPAEKQCSCGKSFSL
ncbi:MAG TPA: iron-sulfur cluster assembly accessory protein [Myxococcota bacterium]|nr:iron-sulfur cluster assembly accessory protein [Myxococcota bacterium]